MGKRYWDDYTSKVSRRSNRWAASDRGWYLETDRDASLGHYLDYGPDHYRSPHEYCRDGRCRCPEFNPGSVHAVSCVSRESRYFVTVEEAKSWIETQAGETAENESAKKRRNAASRARYAAMRDLGMRRTRSGGWE